MLAQLRAWLRARLEEPIPRTCRMCDGRGQVGLPVYIVTVTTPEGSERSAFCIACWEAEARDLPVHCWEDVLLDRLTGQMPAVDD